MDSLVIHSSSHLVILIGYPIIQSSKIMTEHYRVLARKYRPQVFADLIGQDVLVRTLSNAIAQNRIAHAFVLTGIRGIGKTSTARIIAKALNCDKGISISPCGMCEHCLSIAESRHPDVLEMDAASRTGVGDIREIIDTVQYAPTSARYKVYIIDEVHMLSKNAFNALLKTLEEPPSRVIFIFATTEIRKIPITILSRCQRFDLPRIEIPLLASHLGEVAKKEQVSIEENAVTAIAHAAEGSVRDGLSLLDQAIAHADQGQVTLPQVEKMLGRVSKDKIFALWDAVLEGNPKQAIEVLREMHRSGGEALAVLNDLLELVHLVTQAKLLANEGLPSHISAMEATKAQVWAAEVSYPYLARAWQMLLKGVEEVSRAPQSLMAAEMFIIRLCLVSDQPPPGDLLKKIESEPSTHRTSTNTAPAPVEASAVQSFHDFNALVKCFEEKGENFLAGWLKNEVHLVDFKPPKLEIRMSEAAPKDLPGKLAECLKRWTGRQWFITLSQTEGQKTLRQQQQEDTNIKISEVAQDPQVKAVLSAFPGATITHIKTKGA